MWRNLTRGLQQKFKRNLVLDKPDACIKDGNANVHNKKCSVTLTEILPGAYQNLNRCVLKNDSNQDRGDYYQKTSNNVGQHSFFEAFGWSGALVFGWVISKQLWLSHSWPRDKDECNKKRKCIISFLASIVNTQPPVSYVLPQLQSAQNARPTTDKGDKLSSELDDEFEIAAKELEEVHNRAIAEAFNRRGIACVSKSTGSEAFRYFQRASQLQYAPASFNLGQCCELGIGTKQDFQQAAGWYRIASDQGHATATYNLGVFYAHGWGGLPANIETATELFVKAAKLGQPDAKAALSKKSKSNITQLSFKKTNETSQIKSHELGLFLNSIKSGLSEDFQRGLAHEKRWDIPLNSTVAF